MYLRIHHLEHIRREVRCELVRQLCGVGVPVSFAVVHFRQTYVQPVVQIVRGAVAPRHHRYFLFFQYFIVRGGGVEIIVVVCCE